MENVELWTDISVYQNGNNPGKPIDFVRMKLAGVAGVCIRKSTGFYRDSWFLRNWEGAGAAGLKRTFYVVPYYGYDTARQLRAALTIVDARGNEQPFVPGPLDRPWWLDVEYRHTGKRDAAENWIIGYLGSLEEAYGPGQDTKSTRLNSSHGYISYSLFFFNDTATTELSPLPLHDALPISATRASGTQRRTGSSATWGAWRKPTAQA